MSGFKKNMMGFTLAELMVVIAIISLLAVVSLGYIGGQLSRGRDARRRAELEQIRSALEMFRTDNLATGYPDLLTALQFDGYMRQVPNDPFPSIYTYLYTKLSAVTYRIGAFLERGNPDCPGGNTCCPAGDSCGSQNCNYCVFDP